MIIYPSSESKTHYRSFPIASLGIILAMTLMFFLVYKPYQSQFSQEVLLKETIFRDALNKEVDQKSLRHELVLRAFEDPSFIAEDESFRELLELSTIQKYEAWRNVSDPFLDTLESPFPTRILGWITPTKGLILLALAILIFITGFMLEHIFHPIIAAISFAIIFSLIHAINLVIPQDYSLPEAHYWAGSLLAFALLTLWLAPFGTITFTLATWLGKIHKMEIRVPVSLILIAGYASTYILFYFWGSKEYPWSIQRHAPIFLSSFIVWLPFIFLPSRSKMKGKVGISSADEMFPLIERHISQEETKQAKEKIEEAMGLDPAAKTLIDLGDLAWKINATDLAKKAYAQGFRSFSNEGQNQAETQKLFEKMLLREVNIPVSHLKSQMQRLFQADQFESIKRVMPFYLKSDLVKYEEAEAYISELANKILAMKIPDQEYLKSILNWCEQHNFEHVKPKILIFFSNTADDGLIDSYSVQSQIEQHVDLNILEITGQYVRGVLPNGKPQNIPWSAAKGLYGAHVISPTRGYKGCYFLRFKRKVFACHFSNKEIELEENGGVVTFERVWDLFQEHIPEDVPMVAFKKFKDLNTEEEYLEEVEKYLNEETPLIGGSG